MRTALLFVFVFFTAPVFCQNADSLAVVREVDSLIQVSRGLADQRNFDKALEVNAAAEKLAVEKLGLESAGYGSCCLNEGRVLHLSGRYTEAEQQYLHALKIQEKIPLRDVQMYSKTLDNLILLYQKLSRFEEALLFCAKLKRFWFQEKGAHSTEYANALRKTGDTFVRMEQLDAARKELEQARNICVSSQGKENSTYAKIILPLSVIYARLGLNEKAELLIRESVNTTLKAEGRSANYATALNNLGAYYEDIGDNENALQYFLESKTIRDSLLGKDDPARATSLRNLGYLYFLMGRYDQAEPLLKEAVSRSQNSKINYNYTDCVNTLGYFYLTLKQYDQALPLLVEAVESYEKNFRHSNSSYVVFETDLGVCYRAMGKYDSAEVILRHANEIKLDTLGLKADFETASTLELATLYYLQKRQREAAPIFGEWSAATRAELMRQARFLSQRELTKYLHAGKSKLDLTYSFGLDVRANLPEFIGHIVDNTLFFKGVVLENGLLLERYMHTASDAGQDALSQWKDYQRSLAAEYAKPVGERKNVPGLEDKANSLEKELTRSAAGLGASLQAVNWEEVRRQLQPDEVALEYVNFRYVNPNPTDSVLYAVLLLHPGTAQPRFIPLFEEKSLDSLLQTSGERRADYVNHLYTPADRGAKPLGKPQKTLYDLLWKPLEPHLQGVQTIYFSPSGLLHRLNLAAIPINLDSALGDQYNLVELGSTRQLVIPATIKPAANDAILFGGISYDSDSTAMSQANAALDSISIASRGELSFAYTDSTLRVGTWSALPYTDREVGSVEKTLKSAGFQSDTRRGFTATEEAFKTLGAGGKASPRVLHLATHGFFFPDPKSTSARFETSPTFGATEPVFKISDHPMIRSGLLLAGANYAWATGKPLREGMEDGILTAYEISQMNLSNTELVVLSACETGLGDIQGNEGVYGLQRSFKIAGAK